MGDDWGEGGSRIYPLADGASGEEGPFRERADKYFAFVSVRGTPSSPEHSPEALLVEADDDCGEFPPRPSAPDSPSAIFRRQSQGYGESKASPSI